MSWQSYYDNLEPYAPPYFYPEERTDEEDVKSDDQES